MYSLAAKRKPRLMIDLAPTVRKLPVPGRSLWWLVGAGAVGLLVPTMIGIGTALLGYYPVGAMLGVGIRSTGTFLVIVGIALLIVFAGIAYALLAASWRPFSLSIIAFGIMIFGFYPGIASHSYLRKEAFVQLASRSAALVDAIAAYERDAGMPPSNLTALVPKYLSEVPRTGMAAYPDYEYELGSGMCLDSNAWNVSVLAGDVLNFDMFFYCPKRDYPSRIGGDWVEPVGDWAYLHE
jgi:hypothetical protein